MTVQRRMHVLQVGKFYPPHMGGIETHLQTLCGELRKSVEVDVVVASGERRGWHEEVEGVPVSRSGTLMNLAGAPICPGMVRSIRESRADLVHIHLPNPAALLAYFASGHRGPLVLSYHSDVVRQKMLGRAFEPILLRALRRADAIVVATPDYIHSSPILPAFADHCRVIPYGISLEQFDSVDPDEVARIRSDFGSSLILGVGRLVYYKGFEYLIDAMKTVSGRLLLAGDGPLRDSLRARVKSLGLQDRVVLLGKAADVTPYYHAADLFVLPSIARSEAFGIVQLEAMACGRPVINTALDGGVPFVSLHEVTGLTVPPKDTSALSAAINRLLTDQGERSRLGAAARERVEHEFTREVMAERMLALYEEVLSSRRGGVSPVAVAGGSRREPEFVA